MWLVMTSTEGPRIAFNADSIAYIAEPPAVEAALGTGAGIAVQGDPETIIEVRESYEEILTAMSRIGGTL
jgi:hypothetical protein